MCEFEEALETFESWRTRSVDINSFTYTSIFQACSALTDFNSGAQAHADAIKSTLIAYQHGKSAMITMFSSCGRLDYATRVFESIDVPGAMAWTAIIAGYACQGKAAEAPKHFKRIQKWKEAASVRKMMTQRSLRKEVSCSWITVMGKVLQFIEGDKHHPLTEDTYSKLEAGSIE
ncbi:hypothetical protein D5086_007285 [Populus alba]|uniref:Uncharacterized protein n=1 Tax=Populus alba TaxID=43335 RepID=A0ACC4CPH0_POPAL